MITYPYIFSVVLRVGIGPPNGHLPYPGGSGRKHGWTNRDL